MTNNTAQPFRLHWGHGVAAVFVLWALLMASFMYRATQEDTPMAAQHSYEQGLQYEQSLVRQRLALQPQHRIQVLVHAGNIVLTGPAAVQGTLRCQRPADASLDFSIVFVLDANGRFALSTTTLASGPWQLYLSWQHQGQQLEHQQSIVLP